MQNHKTFNVNGRMVESFYLSDNDLIDILNNPESNDDDKRFVTEKIVERFISKCCKRIGDSNEDLFARTLSDFMNGKIHDTNKAAFLMTKDHRYLVNETFKLFLRFVHFLSQDYENGNFDGRNKYACETAHTIMAALKKDHLYNVLTDKIER